MAWLGQNESSGDDLRVWDVAMLGRLPHQAWLAGPSAADVAAVEQALRATQAWTGARARSASLGRRTPARALLARALAVQARGAADGRTAGQLDPPHQSDWLRCRRCCWRRAAPWSACCTRSSPALHADEMLIVAQGGCCTRVLAATPPRTGCSSKVRPPDAIVPVAGQWPRWPATTDPQARDTEWPCMQNDSEDPVVSVF
ncbi:MAG: hypothetical protein R3E92_14750 [Burkholderiaceae bacterium]